MYIIFSLALISSLSFSNASLLPSLLSRRQTSDGVGTFDYSGPLQFSLPASAVATAAPAASATAISTADLDNLAFTTNDTVVLGCLDIFSNGLNGTCWDVLNMTAYFNQWNTTNEANHTCGANELWANCYMRVAGLDIDTRREAVGGVADNATVTGGTGSGTGSGGLGCAQVGPNTCPEPTADNLFGVEDVRIAYGSVAIWSLQNLYTAIYTDLTGENGTEIIQSGWDNYTSTHPGAPVDGKTLLGTILASTPDPRTDYMSLQVTTQIPMPFRYDIRIPDVSGAGRVLGDVLATYLQSSMTNYTLGGFIGMAEEGRLI